MAWNLLSCPNEEYRLRVLRIEIVVVIGSKGYEAAGDRKSNVTRRLTNMTLRQTSLGNIIRNSEMV